MMKLCQSPYVITISHQIGSGGAVIGQKISEQLEIPFIDRQILHQVAKNLQLADAELEGREERLMSFWQSLAQTIAMMDNSQSLLLYSHYIPSDEDLFQEESETIRRIAQNNQAVFLGRCGRYVLKDFPCRFSLLLHADPAARIERISQMYNLSARDAKKMIETNDRERDAYIRTFTRQKWLDAHLYDLCLNTSSIGFDHAAELVLAAIKAKFAIIAGS